MARRPNVNALKITKKRVVRTTKTELQLINAKYLGQEPTWTSSHEVDPVTYMKTMTWYNYMCTKDDARKYLETYLKNTSRDTDVKTLKGVPDSRIVDQTAWIVRILSRGAKLNQKTMEFLNDKIKEQLSYAVKKTEVEEKAQEKPKTSIQDRVSDKVSDFIGQFEEAIDRDSWTLSMYEWLQKHEIQPMLASRVAAFYRPIAEEAELLATKPDAQLAEAYNHYTKKQIKERAAFYASIMVDCERFSSNVKKTRAPRKPKAMTTEKQLKYFKFLKESKEYRVASIQPEKLLGAQELWTFNTKYKLLTVFYALDRAGLGVTGTSIKNYDENKSMTKRVGKKTEQHVQTVLTGGKRVVIKMLAELKDAPNLQHRINENTVLLKINKE
jgi:hypothetical protein